MPSIPDHPGVLGRTSRATLEILHADWPMYPVDHGWEVALETLGQFPKGSALRQIDDIDQCFLFVLGDEQAFKDPFNRKYLHAAIWHEDLFALHKKGYVNGASRITLEEWIEKRRAESSGLFSTAPDGTMHPIPGPTPEDFPADRESLGLMVRDIGIALTESGWAALENELANRRADLHPSLKLRAIPIVGIGQFDTAVREGCLLIETRLRHIIGSASFGQALVGEVDAYLSSSQRFIPAQLKMLNGDLRTAFKFVRNEYMHGLQELTAVQCYALLARVSRLLFMLDDVEAILPAR